MNTQKLFSLGIFTVVGAGVAENGFWFLSEVAAKNATLLFIVATVCLVLKRSTAAVRHVIWATTLAAMIMMPMFSICLPEWNVIPSIRVQEQVEVAGIESTAEFKGMGNELKTSEIVPLPSNGNIGWEAGTQSDVGDVSNDLLEAKSSGLIQIPISIVILIWGLGAIVCLFPALWSAIVLCTYGRNACGKDREKLIVDSVKQVSTRLAIRAPVVVLGTAEQMPMVWQFWRSYLLLPECALDWCDERLNAVLLHELVHLRRRDPLTLLIGQVARALNWFNPMAWYAFHRMRIEQEQACDDFVLRSGVVADRYASHLLDLSTTLQSTFVQESVALAMASKSKVENRLQQILNPLANRRPLSVVSSLLLFATVLSLAILFSSLASTNATASTDRDDDEEVEIMWPYCELESGHQVERSIEDAIHSFNRKSKQSPIGSQQPPITIDEVTRAANEALERGHYRDETLKELRNLLVKKSLSPNVQLRRFTRFDDGERMHGVWWVRLVIGTDSMSRQAITIRATHVYSRPYTLMERQQISDGRITLLNRLSSYYQSIPATIDNVELDQSASRFARAVEKELKQGTRELVLKRFNWNKVNSELRKFASSEIDEIMNSNIQRVGYVPRALDGELLTWRAFNLYKPNLTVEGFLKVEYLLPGRSIKRTRELEVGRNAKGDYFFVGYVADRRVPMPKVIKPGISITGHNFIGKEKQPWEPLVASKKPMYMTWDITNPGKLVSAHLSNEEIWLRDLEGDYSPNVIGATEVVTGDDLADELTDVVWGDSTDGLLAAVVLTPTNNDREFDVSFYVKNDSQVEVRLESEKWRQLDEFSVWTDDEARTSVNTISTWFSGEPRYKTHVLRPGKVAKMESGTLSVAPKNSEQHFAAKPYGFRGPTGKYLVRFRLNFPKRKNESNWSGVLETGLTPLTVTGAKETKKSEEDQSINVQGRLLDSVNGEPILKPVIIQGGKFDPNDPEVETKWGYTETSGGRQNGRYSLTVRPTKGWTARVLVEGYLPMPIDLARLTPGKQRVELDLKLVRGRQVSGVVLDHLGKPLAGAKVFAVGPTGVNLFRGNAYKYDSIDTGAQPLTTDDQGRFKDLRIDESGRLAVSSVDFSAWPVSVDDNKNEIEVRLPEPGKLIVKYDREFGPKNIKALLQLLSYRMGEKWEKVTLEQFSLEFEKGEAVLSGMPPGPYQITNNVSVRFTQIGRTIPLNREFFNIEPGKSHIIDWTTPSKGARLKAKIDFDQKVELDGMMYTVQSERQQMDGENKNWVLNVAGGKVDLDSRTINSWKLPPGKYKLIVQIQKPIPEERLRYSGIILPDYNREIEFTVADDGPEEIDLGTITLDDFK